MKTHDAIHLLHTKKTRIFLFQHVIVRSVI